MTESLIEAVPIEVGEALEKAVQVTLAALEKAGVSARDADDFVRESVFNAWAGWDYEGPAGD